MVFVDELAYFLFAIAFSGFFILYIISILYLRYRKGKRDIYVVLNEAIFPILMLGLYITVMGVYDQTAWPLPGSYNMLFYDPFVSLGLVLIAFALSVHFKKKIHYVGFFSLMTGVMTIIYGILGYSLNLTSSPFAFFLLYLAFGGSAILAYPVSLIMDTMPGYQKKVWIGWNVVLVLFWISLLLASIGASALGVLAISSHLAITP